MIFFLSAAFLMMSSSAEACSYCMSAMVDQILPPFMYWVCFSVVWFLALSVIRTIRKEKIETIPSLGWAIPLLIGFYLIGKIILGAQPCIVLLLLSLIASVQAFFPSKKEYSSKFKRDFKIIGGLSIVTMLLLSANSVYIHQVRKPSEFILQWQSTVPGRNELKRLVFRGATGLPDLRIIVKKGGPTVIAMAAQGLGKFGEPEIDMPLLIKALPVVRSKGYKKQSADIEKALFNLSGISLPEGASEDIWRKEWQNKLQGKQDTSTSYSTPME